MISSIYVFLPELQRVLKYIFPGLSKGCLLSQFPEGLWQCFALLLKQCVTEICYGSCAVALQRWLQSHDEVTCTTAIMQSLMV